MGRSGRYCNIYRGTYSTRSRRGRYNSNNSQINGSFYIRQDQEPEKQVPKNEPEKNQEIPQTRDLQLQHQPPPPKEEHQQQAQQQQPLPVSERNNEGIKVEETLSEEYVKSENNTTIGMEIKDEKEAVNSYHEESEKNVSATTKALEKIDDVMEMKRSTKKKSKMSPAVRRRKMNERLNRILCPKSGVVLLHELKPGCNYKIHEELRMHQRVIIAEIIYKGKVLAVGEGLSKPLAKNNAAENAIRIIVGETVSKRPTARKDTGNAEELKPKVEELMEIDDLPWAGLASFAMYKMFSEWQSQGTDLQLFPLQQSAKKTASSKLMKLAKKELPPNADQIHPSLLLNSMIPGLLSVELERTSIDNVCCVTMGFEINGIMYTGSGPNKKEARKKAAMAVLTSIYGIKYEG